MRRIRRTRQAKLDIIEIWRYIAFHNRDAADRLLRQFNEKLRALAMMPQMGKSRAELGRSLRSGLVGKYLLFYREIDDGIELIRVVHGARDPDQLFSDDETP